MKTLIRVGSCGAVREDVKLRDVVIGMGACTDSKVNRLRFRITTSPPSPTSIWWPMPCKPPRTKGVAVRVGNIFSADLFTPRIPPCSTSWKSTASWGVEMEAAGIYGVAAEYGAKALTICTVSDHIRTGEQTTSEERQLTFNDMIEIALDSRAAGRLIPASAPCKTATWGFFFFLCLIGDASPEGWLCHLGFLASIRE